MASKDDDLLKEAKEAFALAQDAESDNRREAEEDIRFGRLGDQWDSALRAKREAEGRPCLQIPRLNAFMRQVINDARQNKPSIKVKPADSGADPETAEIFDGLIRNIEQTSNADVAYDTAAEHAVAGGFGYWRIGLDYAHEDTFDLDIRIERVGNQFSVYGDPHSTAADSSDWNNAFVVESVPKATFKRLYPKATATDWDAVEKDAGSPWVDGETVMVAEYWTREEYDKEILKLDDGTILSADTLQGEMLALVEAGVIQVVEKRTAKCWKVKQHTLTGAEVLNTRDWPGQYIPIVPVYGDEVNLKGKRHFRSLICDAKDAQRMHNIWRSTSTELVALAPRTPWLLEEGSAVDEDKWATANRVNHPYLEYKRGQAVPVRLELDSGPAAGAIQEALMASDDMKAVMGLYDASLGARSNETSGRAIIARQREGDVSTFHFIDNVSRAIRHTGRILIDMIPKVYDKARIIRVLGEDGEATTKPINQPVPVTDPETGEPVMQEGPAGPEPMMRVYDLSAGKYDLTVATGPSFSTRREEAAYSMNEALRAWPDAGPVIVPELAKNLDWPGADDIAAKLEALAPKPPEGMPPEVQQAIQELEAKAGQLEQENAQLKSDKSAEQAKLQMDAKKAQMDAQTAQSSLMLEGRKIELEAEKLNIEREKLRVAQFEADTARMVALKPEPAPTPFPQRAA